LHYQVEKRIFPGWLESSNTGKTGWTQT